MLFYINIVSIAAILGGIASIEKKKKCISILFMVLAGIVLFVPLAMRGMGVDYINYQTHYNIISSNHWAEYWKNYVGNPEPLYVVLNFLAHGIFHSFQGINVLCALISITVTCVGIYRYRNYINMGLTVWCFGFLLYIYMYGLNRMMIAVPIVMLSYKYIVHRKFIRFCTIIVIAGLFHYSALLMIPLYFIIKWMDSDKVLFKGAQNTILSCGVITIFAFVYLVAPRLFSGFSWYARYKGYFELEFRMTSILTNAPIIALLIVFYFFNKQVSRWWGENKSIISMTKLIVVLILICLFFQIYRVVYLLYPCAILLSGSIPEVLKRRNEYQQSAIIVVVFYIAVITLGVFWIYYATVIETNWASFINPYVLGGF